MLNDVIHPEVIGLSGGLKQAWLRLHRDEVLDYYHRWGPDACRSRFNMREYTLRAFLISRPQIKYENMTGVDRALFKAEQALESYREIRHRLNDVESQLEEMVPMVQIGYGFLKAVAQVMPAIELKNIKDREDPLSLANFPGRSGK